MLRLVAYAPNGPLRFPLGTGPISMGSAAGNDVVLDFDGVEPLHAVLRRRDLSVTVAAHGHARIEINGHVCDDGELELLDELVLGTITVILEDTATSVDPGLLRGRATLEGPGDAASGEHGGSASFNAGPFNTLPFNTRAATTAGALSTENEDSGNGPEADGAPTRLALPEDQNQGVALARQRVLEHLSHLSSWVLSDSVSNQSLESVLTALLQDFGGGAVVLFEGPPDKDTAVKLLVTREQEWVENADEILGACREHATLGVGRTLGHFDLEFGDRKWLVCFRAARALDREYFGAILIPALPFQGWTPEVGFATVIDLIVLGLVHHVGRYEPILPGRGEQRELTLAPGLIVGPSPRMERLVSTMQAVADSSSHVLILGEPGSGRELVARSLHGSGPGRKGPFVVVDCSEEDETQLAADLFGAEIQGKTGPVRREGKLQLAADGTLFLRGANRLPFTLQGRLMRVLRAGRVSGPGIEEEREIELRIMSTSDSALLKSPRKTSFRVDLATSLCQLTVEVPPLRDRIEDLPLLLQTLVNRFAHETGKRVRGITTRTLQTLAAYEFPGNLQELENTVRQMIFLAPDEGPLDLDLLPASIRQARVLGRADSGSTSVQGLNEMVARLERKAIVEALEKSRGNKAKAARLLGVSRNGLAQKMRRHQL